MLWTPNFGPMGVTREQVVVGWLKQPGNFERFMQARSANKRLGTARENKREVAGLVCTLLQNAGFHGHTPHGVVIKLIAIIKSYKRAHALATSGASQSQVRDVCSSYYDLVEHIGTAIDANNKYASYPVSRNVSRPRRVLRPRVLFQATSQAVVRKVAGSKPPNRASPQHKGQSLNQQARKTRIEEIQAQTALIQQMREAGFSKDEIASHLQLLQQ